ncbi:MAG TPA: alpha/beta fold hydrolase [Thermoanaerobaculia bacterium]|nr:alpha/beta fold hydrolase [Thermoanaerobaculia bacterium]
MRKLLIAAVLLIASTVRAADPAEPVRQAEIAFAKAFADRDADRFFSFVADDATFMSGLRTLSGKKAIVESWSRFFKTPQAPFSWGPERVTVGGGGTIGLSTGPVFDANGTHTGNYISTWQKQADGSWKVVFDGPGSPAACTTETAAKFDEGFVNADDGVKLHYRRLDAGSPITLIIPLEHILYDDFRQLADVANIVSYDLRNRGRSEAVKDVNTLTIEQDVRDLEAVRRELKIDKFVPIGFSYLGKMVAMYTLAHPEHVSRVIQLGPVAMQSAKQYPPELSHGREDMGLPEADAKKWEALKASSPESREFCEADAVMFSYLLVGDPAHHTRIRSYCDLPNEMPAAQQKHFAKLWPSIMASDLSAADVKKITVPVLTIHGTKDRNAAYGGGREWALNLPDARLLTIEGAAHVSWADDPVRVFGAIRQFLRGIWPAGAEKVTSVAR